MPSLGLTALLNHEGRIALEEYLLPATETLPVRLPVGITTERHLVTNGKLPALLTELNRYYDLVLLDSPPILLSADTERLSEISGGVLLIVEAGQTQPGELKRAAHLLERLSPPVIATILNRAKIYQGGGYFAELLEEYTTGHKPKHHWIKRLFT
jgi:Mrp family chromosome partitioning ATPase